MRDTHVIPQGVGASKRRVTLHAPHWFTRLLWTAPRELPAHGGLQPLNSFSLVARHLSLQLVAVLFLALNPEQPMRILAISDVHTWDGYERLVDEHKPDVVALAGDLTSDGGAAFWNDALEEIPAFRRARDAAFKRKGITTSMSDGIRVIRGGSFDDVHAIEDPLKHRYHRGRSHSQPEGR